MKIRPGGRPEEITDVIIRAGFRGSEKPCYPAFGDPCRFHASGTAAFRIVPSRLPLRPLRSKFFNAEGAEVRRGKQSILIRRPSPLFIRVHPCSSVSNDRAHFDRRRTVAGEHGRTRRSQGGGGWTRMDTDENSSRRTHGKACRRTGESGARQGANRTGPGPEGPHKVWLNCHRAGKKR